MNIIQRAQAPTPKFFRKVRTIGLILAAASASILAAPVALPVVVVQIAGYLAVAGSVATAIAQTATEQVVGQEPHHIEENKNKGG
jgi:hypothetical protein